MGEQFAAQIFRCIPEREWLFKFGRVPMNLVMSEALWAVRTPFHSPTPILYSNHLPNNSAYRPP